MLRQHFCVAIWSDSAGLNNYLEEIRRFPILAPPEESKLMKRWGEH